MSGSICFEKEYAGANDTKSATTRHRQVGTDLSNPIFQIANK